MTIIRSFALVFAFAVSGTSASPARVLSANDAGMIMVQRLERRLQFENLPDICTGYELIIDEIPDGRESCTCDGISVNCLFHAQCEEDEKDEARCSDTVQYVVSFEEQQITVLSCAAIAEGGFEETCAKVSLAPDLQLDECVLASYGGQPCECRVCDDRNSLELDCSAYDPRATTDCQALGLGQMQPMVHGFNTTAPPPPPEDEPSESVDTPPADTVQAEEGSGGITQTPAAVALLPLVASLCSRL